MRAVDGPPVEYLVYTDRSGYFTIDMAISPGTYRWWAKNYQTLANAGIDIIHGPSHLIEFGTLSTGDALDDNCIDVGDFNVIRPAFGTIVGDPNYDGRADLDGDNTITVADFVLMKRNFGDCGAGYDW